MNKIKIKNIILSLFKLRIISYNEDVDIERLKEENELWFELENSNEFNDILNWRKKIKKYAWGKDIDFRLANENWSIQEEEYYKSFVSQFLGFRLFRLIDDDVFFNNFVSEISSEQDLSLNYIDEIINNDNLRENNFKDLNLDYTINLNKINDEIISKLAAEICEKFNIKRISFSYSIPDYDVLRYLFQLAYSFSAFSKILKNSNLGFGELSLCFEYKDIGFSCYSLLDKTIYFPISDFGTFSHEWLHFIDHRLMNYLPLFNNDNTFLSNLNLEEYNYDEDLRELNLKINNKFLYKDTDIIKSIYSVKLVLKSLPDIFKRFIRKNPNNKNVFNQLLIELDLFIFEMEKVFNNKKEMLEAWDKINDIVEIKIKELPENKEEISKSWKQYSLFIERMCFNEYLLPKKPMWCIYSMLFDSVNNKNYFFNKEEMLARSFEIYIRAKMKKKSWLSHKNEYSLIYPREKELEEEINWWENNIQYFFK